LQYPPRLLQRGFACPARSSFLGILTGAPGILPGASVGVCALKTLKLTCLSVLVAVALVGCDEDPTQVSTVPTGTSVPTGSGTATLSWEAPTTYTNGAALTNLGGYRIYYGTSADNLSQTIQLSGVGMQTYVIDNLGGGTWFFAIKAITNSGLESGLSDVVSKTI
jgi:hypothetical protein